MVATLTVLGPVALDVDGHAVAIGRRRERVLLGVLGLRRTSRPLPVERLHELLSGSYDDTTDPRAALQVAVSRLRRTLAPYGAGISYRNGTYSLVAGELVVDARRFHDLVLDGFAAADRQTTAARLGTALDQWTGEPLAEMEDSTARTAALAEADELRLLALQRWTEIQATLGQHADIVSRLRPVVAERPTDEKLVGQLMSALARSGRLAEALELYIGTRRQLTDDLGVDPSPDLSGRYVELLRAASASAARLRAAELQNWSRRYPQRAFHRRLPSTNGSDGTRR